MTLTTKAASYRSREVGATRAAWVPGSPLPYAIDAKPTFNWPALHLADIATGRLDDGAITLRVALLGAVAVLLQSDKSRFGEAHAGKTHPIPCPDGPNGLDSSRVNFEHNCSRVMPTTISVIQAPQHGTLDVRNEDVRATDPDVGHGNALVFEEPGRASPTSLRAREPTLHPETALCIFA